MRAEIRYQRLQKRLAQTRKRCTRCKTIKPVEEFRAVAHMGPGSFTSRCKTCLNEMARDRRDPVYQRSWRIAHPGYTPDCYARAGGKRAYMREKMAGYRTQEAYKARIVCYRSVAKALKDGTLTKPSTCEVCKQQTEGKDLQLHHPSYDPSQWLFGQWLCRQCHKTLHMAINTNTAIPNQGRLYRLMWSSNVRQLEVAQ